VVLVGFFIGWGFCPLLPPPFSSTENGGGRLILDIPIFKYRKWGRTIGLEHSHSQPQKIRKDEFVLNIPFSFHIKHDAREKKGKIRVRNVGG
jgi:hypothetical protein